MDNVNQLWDRICYCFYSKSKAVLDKAESRLICYLHQNTAVVCQRLRCQR